MIQNFKLKWSTPLRLPLDAEIVYAGVIDEEFVMSVKGDFDGELRTRQFEVVKPLGLANFDNVETLKHIITFYHNDEIFHVFELVE